MKWIKCCNELPEIGQKILALNANRIECGVYVEPSFFSVMTNQPIPNILLPPFKIGIQYEDEFESIFQTERLFEFNYWMPLPEMPGRVDVPSVTDEEIKKTQEDTSKETKKTFYYTGIIT